jgi:hypothetical protein
MLHIMRRSTLGALCMWLSVGSAITVAVAWGFAIAGEGERQPPQATNIADPRVAADGGWIVWVVRGLGSDRLIAQGNVALVLEPDTALPRWSSLEGHCLARSAASGATRQPWDQVWFVTEDAAGWPFRALWSRRDDTTTLSRHVDFRTFGAAPRQWTDLSKPPVADARTTIERLPLRVLVAGFVADAAIWGGVIWCVLRGPSALRRWHRARRHRCVRCGYQLAMPMQPLCPECGTPSITMK